MIEQPLMDTYNRIPIAIERGEGCWLFDTNGNKYFDTFSGIAVCGLGHNHHAVVAAIKDQAGRLMHCSNTYHIPLQSLLAHELCAISSMDKAFFTNSGAEANETAIKLARQYGHQQGMLKPNIIVMENAFHGRTMATLTATGNRKVQAGFEPLLSGFVRAPFNNMDAIKTIAQSNHQIIGVLLEPIQGEGGLSISNQEYLTELRDFCTQKGWLLMLDEVQTGNGRTGSYFAYQEYDIKPDIVTTAKGLGNGFPIGACLASKDVAKVFHHGSHGSSFGGNPLACAAALAVINTIKSQNLDQRAKVLGKRILAGLQHNFGHVDYIHDIRGKGLMIGIDMDSPCPELITLARSTGLLLNVTADKVIRLLPALTMTDEETEFLIHAVTQIIKLYAGDDRKIPRD